MNKIRFITKSIFAILLVFPSLMLLASQELPLMWNSVEVDAEEELSVRVVRNSEDLRIKSFILRQKKQEVIVKDNWYSDITQPLLSTLKLTRACSSLSLGDSGKLSKPSCIIKISFEFLEELEGVGLPDWYENPRAIFFIENSLLKKRVIERKVSRNTWNLSRLDAEGNKSKGQVKVAQ